MGPSGLILSLAYLFLQILSTKAFKLNFYVKSNGCSLDAGNCDGSIDYPFPDLLLALKTVEQTTMDATNEIALILQDSFMEIPEMAEHQQIFSSKEVLNLTIMAESSKPTRTKLKFISFPSFSFLIKGGRLSFANIDFEGDLGEAFIKFDIPGLLQSKILSPGFFYIVSSGKINLEFMNISFSGIFKNINKNNHLFLALIYVDSYTKNGFNSQIVNISLDGLSVINTHYPQGLLYSNAFINTNNDNIKNINIRCTNLKIANYSNKNFMHWKTTYYMEKTSSDYYDFLFIVNNTNIEFENLSVINSSRIILANKNNILNLKNMETYIPLDVQVLDKSPPEMIYLINRNIINAREIYIVNSTIYSFDDMVEPNNRDLSFVDSKMVPASMFKMEKNQALFAFIQNNTGSFSLVYVKNCFLFKKENLILTIFGLENKNKLKVSDLNMENVTIDTESRIGIICVFHTGYANEVVLVNGLITDLSTYGYAVVLFGNVITANFFNISTVNFVRSYFKTKSNKAEVDKFMDGVNTSPNFVFVNNSVQIKTAGIFLLLVSNIFYADHIMTTEALCLYGCFATAFYKNTLTINQLVANQARSEVMSSIFTVGLYNTITGKSLSFYDCRANSGVIYTRKYNVITLEDSQFLSNMGNGGFGMKQKPVFYHISGNIALSIENKLSLKNCLVTSGKADITGGGLYFREKNSVQIELCTFIENEASMGGAIFALLSNNITIKRSSFINNYAKSGAAIYGENLNIITILDNSSAERNRGESGAGFYLNGNNTMKINSCLLLDNHAFVGGCVLVVSGVDHWLELTNVSFVGNKSPFNESLVLISQNNIVIIKGALVDRDNSGGNFLYLGENNTLFASFFDFRNIMDITIYFNCYSKNNLQLSNSTIQNSEWHDAFVSSQLSNKISITDYKIFDIIITDTASGFVSLFTSSSLYLKNITYRNLTGKNNMVIKAFELNIITIETLTLTFAQIFDKGSCFSLVSNNTFKMQGTEFSDFQGFSNNLVLFGIEDSNSIHIFDTYIHGYLSLEEVWSSTSLINVSGNNNIINIANSITLSNNPSSLNLESLSFLVSEGFGNFITIINTTVTIKNYKSFFTINSKSTIFLLDTHFKKCEVNGDLFLLRNQSSFTCTGSKFHLNVLQKGRSIVSISEKAVVLLKRVSCNTNTLFINSQNAFYNISKSRFVQKDSTHKYPSPFAISGSNSVGFFDFIEMFLRENMEDSIIIVVASKVVIKFSSFGFNIGLHGGVLRLSDQSSLILELNSFYGNEALHGGVLKFENISNIYIVGNYFFSNVATNRLNKSDSIGKGGCIYASIDKNQNFEFLEIRNNNFKFGGAEIGGVIYFHETKSAEYYLNRMTFMTSNQFKQIKVRHYGPFIASHPNEMRLVKGQDLNTRASNKIILDEKIPFTATLPSCLFQVVLLDIFNQTAIGEKKFEASKLNMEDSNGYSLDFTIRNSFLCLSSFQPASFNEILKLSDRTSNLSLNSSLLTVNGSTLKENNNLEIEFNIRKCSRGEYFDLKQLECLPCQPNFYSFENDFIEPTSCKSCTQESFYCYGGFNHTPRPGYWRSSAESTNFLKCPVESSCLGDPMLHEDNFIQSILLEDFSSSIEKGVCSFEYQGVLCHKCRKGYAKTAGQKCSPCSGGISIFLMALKLALRIFLYYYTIYKAVMMCHKVKDEDLPTNLVYSNFLLKIMILHLQFLRSYTGLPLIFPTLLKDLFNIFSFSISSGADKVLNLECFFDFEYFPASYIYSLINIIAPLLVVTSIVILLQKNDVERMKESGGFLYRYFSKVVNLPYLFIIALMLSYDEIVRLLIISFSYINIYDENNPDLRVDENFEIEFHSSQHQLWIYTFSLPATIIIGLLIPCYIVYRIFRAKQSRELYKKATLLRFGYFFFAYKENHVLYDMVYTLRRIFLIVMDIFFIHNLSLSNKYNPVMVSIVICFFYTGLSFFIFLNRPYKQNLYPVLNRIEFLSVNIQALTSWIGCLVMSLNEETNESARQIIYFFGFISSGLLNFAIFVLWGFFYWKMSIAFKIQTAIKSIKVIKKKISEASKRRSQCTSPTSKRKVTIDLKFGEVECGSYEDVEDFNAESVISLPLSKCDSPSRRNHWTLKKEMSKGSGDRMFYIVNTPEINPILGETWMQFLWKTFENRSECPLSPLKAGKILHSKWKHLSIKSLTKTLNNKGDSSSSLDICIQLQIEEMPKDDIDKLITKEIKVVLIFLFF